ncbi:MAG: TlpA family protein disulfide reductase [Rhodospirillaceae bacterium]|nr:TlpA family protein disulfide reductase [Rhodospirillaceae bacterium]
MGIRRITAVLTVLGICVALTLTILLINRDHTSGRATYEALPAPGGPLTLHPEPRPLPPLTFTDGAGNAVSLEAFAGKAVLLNFWATWCQPCLIELPALIQLNKELSGKNFAFIALSEDLKGAETVLPFLEAEGMESLPVYYDPNLAASRALTVRRMPTTLLIDAQGREAARYEGTYEWDGETARALIEGLMGPGDAGTKAETAQNP